jgi:hypothetical protein
MLNKKLLFCIIIFMIILAFPGCKNGGESVTPSPAEKTVTAVTPQVTPEKSNPLKEEDKKEITELIDGYYGAIQSKDYEKALSLMTDGGQKYYGMVENFKSTFVVPGLEIKDYKLLRVDGSKDGKIDKATAESVITYSVTGVFSDTPVENTETKIDGFTREKGKWRVNVKFGPYRCVEVNKEAKKYDLMVKVHAIDIYPDYVTVNVSFKNTGKENIFILPYNKLTGLTCDGKQVLPPVDLPFSLDSNLYKGVTIPGGKIAPGFINFNGRLAADAKKLDLKIDGNLNIVKKAKFAVEVKDIKL